MISEKQPANERPVRIAHVIFRLDIGGLENGLVNLINGLPRAEFEHIVICLDTYTDFRRRIVRDDVRLLALNKRPGLNPGMYLRLWKQLRALRPDVVHTRNLGTLPCIAVAAASGVPVRIHGEHGWDMMDIKGEELRYRFLRRIISPLVSIHVAVSRHIVRWLIDSVGITATKIVQISNGVDTARFSPVPQGLRGRDSSAEEADANADAARKVVVGTVGRLEHVKDQRTLIVALGLLKQRRPDLAERLMVNIVGDGSLANELEMLVEKLDLGRLVRLLGRQDDIPGHLRNMDIFVLPSLNEGISNTILEAMATGLPVVATAVGGTPEIVRDGQTGTLVEVSNAEALAQALIAYCDDPGLRAQHGQAAREQVLASMSLASMIDRYRDLYIGSLNRGKNLQAKRA